MDETAVRREKLGIELITSVVRRDEDRLRRILAMPGLDLEYQDEHGRTALYVAAQRNFLSVAAILFDAGASTLTQSSSRFAALQMFAVRGWYSLLEGALHREADVNTVDGLGYSLLMHAADGAEHEAVSLLLARGAHADFRQPYGLTTPMHLAAGSGSIESLEMLVQAGAAVHPRNAYDAIPLHFAARSGHPEACRWFLERGADINAQTQQGFTPVMLAALGNDADTMSELLHHGADDSCYSNGGSTLRKISKRSGPELFHICAAWQARKVIAHVARQGSD